LLPEVLLTVNPIHKVLSTLSSHRLQYLLIGGQACILYGAAEFSRDADIVLLASPDNLNRLSAALRDLEAELIAVPPLRLDYLQKGHAVHFRCRRSDVSGLRIDILSRMRGVDEFEALWGRRTTVEIGNGEAYDLISLPDLVLSKKTQRDKDWPMIRRLVEAHYYANRERLSPEQVEFWLREARTPELLIEVAAAHPAVADSMIRTRPLISLATGALLEELERALAEEQARERVADRAYWQPLREELERLPHAR
jgi:hypothetical protein